MKQMRTSQTQPIKEEEKPCIVCGKKVQAFYGMWGRHGEGTCSRKCEYEQQERSSYLFDGRE